MIDKKDLKIVFFGTPEFAVKSLEALVNNNFNVASIVTMPDKPAGRGRKLVGSDVKNFAVEHNIPVLQPEKLKDETFISELKEINADLFIVIAFRMLPKIVWEMPRLGTFNLHASLLPKYRGAAPINRAIMNGETESGVTTFFLKHEIDTGDIIGSRKVAIESDDNAGTLHDKLMVIGADMVIETCNDILAGELHPTPQPDGDFSPAPKIFKDDCRIDWNKNALVIHNHVRGLAPYPAAWSLLTDCNGKETSVKILSTKLTNEDCTDVSCGKVKHYKHRLFAATADKWIEIIEIQPSGKKSMLATAFLAGNNPSQFI